MIVVVCCSDIARNKGKWLGLLDFVLRKSVNLVDKTALVIY